jgi:hypothetical protein
MNTIDMEVASTLTWLIKYFYRNLQFLSHVIIIKTNVFLPQTYMTIADFGYPT